MGNVIAIGNAIGRIRRGAGTPARGRRRAWRGRDRLTLLMAGGLTIGAAVAIFAYLVARDQMLAKLVDRQSEMQYAYEDRISALQSRLQRATRRSDRDADGVETKLGDLQRRQQLLEARSVMVAKLVALSAENGGLTQGAAPPSEPATPQQSADPALRLGHARETRRDSAAPPLAMRIDDLDRALTRAERLQSRHVDAVARQAIAAADRIKRAFDIAGVPPQRYFSPTERRLPIGGPYVARRGASDPESQLGRAQNAVATLAEFRRALPMLPLHAPVWGELQATSSFGYRTDPFLGRPALHSGVDLREEYGAPVRAAAAGVVAAAGPSGGYGDMVEIHHGGGLATRYGHLSAIDVAPGQQLAPGDLVGRVGSSGRSTGPHLHYEVRVDGEAVDPERFLKAAATLAP